MSARDPPRVPSSRYKTQNSDLSDEIKSCIARQKRRGPRGSPCCIPSHELMVYSPKNRKEV